MASKWVVLDVEPFWRASPVDGVFTGTRSKHVSLQASAAQRHCAALDVYPPPSFKRRSALLHSHS